MPRTPWSWPRHRPAGLDSGQLLLGWLISPRNSRWRCGCKSLGLRNFGKAVGTLGGRKEGEKQKRGIVDWKEGKQGEREGEGEGKGEWVERERERTNNRKRERGKRGAPT